MDRLPDRKLWKFNTPGYVNGTLSKNHDLLSITLHSCELLCTRLHDAKVRESSKKEKKILVLPLHNATRRLLVMEKKSQTTSLLFFAPPVK